MENRRKNRRIFEKIDFFNFCWKCAGFCAGFLWNCDFLKIWYISHLQLTGFRRKLHQIDSNSIWVPWIFIFFLKKFENLIFLAPKLSKFHRKFHWKYITWWNKPHIMKYSHFYKLFGKKIIKAKTGAKTGAFLKWIFIKFQKYQNSQYTDCAGFCAGFPHFSSVGYHILIDHQILKLSIPHVLRKYEDPGT